jgi:uncharacterized protein GlcG (DUF336 family)
MHLESLEPRRLLSVAQHEVAPSAEFTQLLGAADVRTILKQAGAAARGFQVVAVVDREANILGIFELNATADLSGVHGAARRQELVGEAIARAMTVTAFQSTQDAFSTRTARFIIQDHFPPTIDNTPGGPLYGVQFSSLAGSDVLPGLKVGEISGDPGGIPLYKGGVPVGGIGVAGDGHDIAARADLLTRHDPDNPHNHVYNGTEEHDFDEAVALAGAAGYMAPPAIQADNIFIAGLRLPFVAESPAPARAVASLNDLITGPHAVGVLAADPSLGKPTSAVLAAPHTKFPIVTLAGISGQMKNPNPAAVDFGLVAGNDSHGGVPAAQNLTVADVRSILTHAAQQAIVTRAGIRQPIGVAARVHIAVVDTNGDVLGVFRMGDGTNFSYDVAVQKARTAAFFSDARHAISTRAVGFLAQAFFPPGIGAGIAGPLYHLQNQLSQPANFKGPLKDGITIFPGGEPLYKNGVLVGAIGVSGDGVDQDDLISFAGTKDYAPPPGARSDQLSDGAITTFLVKKVKDIFAEFTITPSEQSFILGRLAAGLDGVRMPYVKFPRNPQL